MEQLSRIISRLYISVTALLSKNEARDGLQKGPCSHTVLEHKRFGVLLHRTTVKKTEVRFPAENYFSLREVIFLFFSTGCDRTGCALGESSQAHNS